MAIDLQAKERVAERFEILGTVYLGVTVAVSIMIAAIKDDLAVFILASILAIFVGAVFADDFIALCYRTKAQLGRSKSERE